MTLNLAEAGTSEARVCPGAPVRPRVLHILEATLGGTRRHVTDLLLNLDTARYELTFAFATARADAAFGAELSAIRGRGIETIEVPMVREVSPPRDAASLLAVRRLIRRKRFEIVHAHSSKAGFLARIAGAFNRRPPRSVYIYTPNAISLSLSPVYWIPERLAAFNTDAMVAVSESEREELERCRLLEPSRVVLIRAAVDLERLRVREPSSQIRSELGLPANAPVIGSAGRLCPQKDPLTFIDAAARVLRSVPECRFLWVGSGELREAVLRAAAESGIAGHFDLLPFRPDVARVLSSLDVFVLPSLYESFGYVTCEAMALARPVVATDVAGTRDLVVDGETGYLAQPGDAGGLARLMVKLLQNPAMAREMGRRGRIRVEREFTVRRMAAETQDLYERLLNEAPPCRPFPRN